MTHLSDQELAEKIKRERDSVDALTTGWEEMPEEQRGRMYGGLGEITRAVGIYSILREDRIDGRQSLEEATDWYLRAWEFRRGGENEVQNLMWALLTSVLSRNTELMDTAAGEVAAMEFDNPAYFYQFDIALAGLIRDEDNRVLAAADLLENLENGGAPSRLTYYGGLGVTCRGITTDDLAMVDAGISAILDSHEGLIPKLGVTMDDALVCYPATVFLVLAAERGLPVQDLDCYGNEYVVWELVQDA